MKNLRLIMLASVAVAGIILIVSCSTNNNPENMDDKNGKRQVMSDKNDIEKDAEAVISTTSPIFIMRLSGETLTLYEISGSEENPVTAINIDPSYYPPEDIKELNKGILAYSKEDGFSKLENYTN